MKTIFLFCNRIPDRKPEDQTEILAWIVSLQIMVMKEINKLLTTSIEKGLINYVKEVTMTSVRYIFVAKIIFGDALSLPDGYGKKKSS